MSDSNTPETDAARMFGYGEFGGDWVALERRHYEKHPEGDVVFCEVAKKLERERDEARRECEEAISKLKFAQNELFTILRFQEDEKREHRNLLERLSFFQNRFESMRAERDQAMSDLEELREEQKEEA